MEIPTSLRHLANFPSGSSWLQQLPRLVADLAEHWRLDLGEPYAGSNVSSAEQVAAEASSASTAEQSCEAYGKMS